MTSSPFNPNDFRKTSGKSPVAKAVSSVARAGVSIAGQELSSQMFSIGASLDAITRMGSLQSDSINSGASDEFFCTAGTATNRVNASELTGSRFASSIDGNKYASSVSPEGKMSSASSGPLTYPPDLGDYSIQFTFKEYKRPSPLVQANYDTKLTVNLPLPAQLQESHQTRWRDSDTGLIGAIANLSGAELDADNSSGLAAQGARAGVAIGGGAVAQSLSSYRAGLIRRMGSRAAAAVAGAAISEDVVGTIGQLAGAIINPQLSVFFEGPTFQTHQFAWVFYPQSPDESNLIRNIINEFRKMMLPSAGNTGANILNYPHMVEMKLITGGSENSYLYKMKRAVIESMNVNYAPNGHPMFFKGTKAPKFVEFAVSLKAIEYFLAEDFGGIGGDGEAKYAAAGSQFKNSVIDVAAGSASDVISGLFD